MSDQMIENGQEIEPIEAEDIENPTEEIGDDEIDTDTEENSEGQSESEENPEDDELPEDFSKKVGVILTAERKRLEAKKNQEIAELRNQINQLTSVNQPLQPMEFNQNMGVVNGAIQDPLTGQWVAADSVDGMVLRREQQRYEMASRNKTIEAQVNEARINQEFEKKVREDGLITYQNYDLAYQTVDQNATRTMGMAIRDTTNPAAIVNFLGKNSAELERIKKLPEIQQKKEIYKLEDRLQPKLKTVSKAPAPTGSPAVAHENKPSVGLSSFERRTQQLRQQQ